MCSFLIRDRRVKNRPTPETLDLRSSGQITETLYTQDKPLKRFRPAGTLSDVYNPDNREALGLRLNVGRAFSYEELTQREHVNLDMLLAKRGFA